MKSRGFTLLEMLVASLVMGLAVAGLLSGIDTSVRNAARLADHDRAAMLARAKMDELLLDRKLPMNRVIGGDFPPVLTGGLRGGWRARMTPFERPPAIGAGMHIMERIELEIWWETAAGHQSYRLSAYRAAILQPEDAAAMPPVVQP